MNIQSKPLEETAAREESHAVTLVQGHFLGLLQGHTSQSEKKCTSVYLTPLLGGGGRQGEPWQHQKSGDRDESKDAIWQRFRWQQTLKSLKKSWAKESTTHARLQEDSSRAPLLEPPCQQLEPLRQPVGSWMCQGYRCAASFARGHLGEACGSLSPGYSWLSL
ncbi:hypothetical protein AOLI_G00149610 [Acnodon oligacanthus]